MITNYVQPAQLSPKARRKALSRRTEARRTADGLPVHSFQTLLKDLATLTKNTVAIALNPEATFDLLATPSPTQRRAFELVEVKPKV